MKARRFEQIFDKIKQLRVGVIGDFAVDFYIDIQTTTGEISIETQQEVHWGKNPKTSLGAAGNVVQNVHALGVAKIQVFGYTGHDIFGREMRYMLHSLGVNTDGLLAIPQADTCTYTKPLQKGIEQNRLDFGTNNRIEDADFEAIIQQLVAVLPQLDVVLVNQQFPNPLLTPARIAQLNDLIQQFPDVLFVADLRDFGNAIRGATLKVNTAELGRMLGLDPIENSQEWCSTQAEILQNIIQAPVLVTRGERGLLYTTNPPRRSAPPLPRGDNPTWAVSSQPSTSDLFVETQTTGIPLSSDEERGRGEVNLCIEDGYALTGPLDTVGAGDTVLAAFAVTKAVEASPQEALQIANAAAAVTVQKLHQTGTATPQEIRHILL